MASALQCPACGFKHRLDALDGAPIFSCASCGRLLKTPVEYRRADMREPVGVAASSPGPDAGAVERGGAATRDRTGVLPSAPASATATPGAPARPVATTRRRVDAPARQQIPAVAGLPMRILAWVVAFVLGAVFVRWFAKVTGILTGDSMLDIMTSTGITRYVRVFLLVPVLALVTAALATLFIEGTRWWIQRRNASPSLRASAAGSPDARPNPVAAPMPEVPVPAPAATEVAVAGDDPARTEAVPRRVPERSTVMPPASTPDAGAPQRPRRIPRRDTIS